MKYLIFAFLVIFGLFHRISSSEFWPITISRTWLHPDRFEISMLQKPLLTFLLAFFHIFNVSDVVHIIEVKLVFALLTTAGLFIFSHFVILLAAPEKKPTGTETSLMALVFFLCSQAYQGNFFSVRSDQLACISFAAFLYLCHKNRLALSLLALMLIPLCGIKESLFLIPGLIYYFAHFRLKFTGKQLVYAATTIIAVGIWAVALNLDALFYLLDTYHEVHLQSRFTSNLFLYEYPLLVCTLLSWIYFLAFNKSKALRNISIVSIVLTALLFALPQAYDFYIASITPFIYMPFFVLLYLIFKKYRYPAVSLVVLYLATVTVCKYRQGLPFYETNIDQLTFITRASELVRQNKLSYLDGMGILPKQTFHPCFVSPFDPVSNNSCLAQLAQNKPEVIIVTNRLFGLGDQIFKLTEKYYMQIYPNFYMLNEYVTEDIRKKINLSTTGPGAVQPAILIF